MSPHPSELCTLNSLLLWSPCSVWLWKVAASQISPVQHEGGTWGAAQHKEASRVLMPPHLPTDHLVHPEGCHPAGDRLHGGQPQLQAGA